jgi:galactokinase/mevalonate kinase-like predicted kinase
MGLPTGLQDHYPALLGGALDIRHEVGGEVVRPLTIALEDLGEHLLVAHTGRSHVSAAQNWRVIRARLEGGLLEEFEEIRAAGAAAAVALAASDFVGLARASSADWAVEQALGRAGAAVVRCAPTAVGLSVVESPSS